MDIDYNELFGIDADTGDKGPGAAEPAAEQNAGDAEKPTESEGNGAAASEEDGGGSDSTSAEATEDDDSAPDDKGTDKAPQTKEERAKFAAARRQAEKDAAVEAARKAERERMNAIIKELGIAPKEGAKPLETVEELEAYRKDLAARRLSKKIVDGTATAEDFAAVTPKDARPPVDTGRVAEKPTQATEANAAEEAIIAAQIAEIHALDGSVSTIDDLLKMPNAKAFGDYVRKGNSFVDAYKLANMDKLLASARESASASAINKARSKDHLTATETRGSGAVSVPADELALYRELMPDASEADIIKHYNKYIKK